MLPPLVYDMTILILYPLNSLLRDQEKRFNQASISCICLTGGQSESERNQLLAKVKNGKCSFILSNAETLINPQLRAELKAVNLSLLVVDEAHVVSLWGKSFRKSYAELDILSSDLGSPTIVALSATVGPQIQKDLQMLLFNGKAPKLITTDLDRPNIRYSILNSLQHDLTLRLLCQRTIIERPAIIFCNSRKLCEQYAKQLSRTLLDNNIRFYHAGLSILEKQHIEAWFQQSTSGILVSTCAYGMGVDKRNIRTIIHLELPPSIESFLQESGRAGRDGNPALSIVLKQLSWKHGAPYPAQKLSDFQIQYYNLKTCRRSFLLTTLMHDHVFDSPKQTPAVSLENYVSKSAQLSCCDVCAQQESYTIPSPGLYEIASVMIKKNNCFNQKEIMDQLIQHVINCTVHKKEISTIMTEARLAGLFHKSSNPLWFGTWSISNKHK